MATERAFRAPDLGSIQGKSLGPYNSLELLKLGLGWVIGVRIAVQRVLDWFGQLGRRRWKRDARCFDKEAALAWFKPSVPWGGDAPK